MLKISTTYLLGGEADGFTVTIERSSGEPSASMKVSAHARTPCMADRLLVQYNSDAKKLGDHSNPMLWDCATEICIAIFGKKDGQAFASPCRINFPCPNCPSKEVHDVADAIRDIAW